MIGKLLTRELQKDGVDHGANTGAARLVVEERQLTEVFPGAKVLEDDRRRLAVGAREVNLNRPRTNQIHRRAQIALGEDDVTRLEALLGQTCRKRLAVLVGEPLENRDLGEQVRGTHCSMVPRRRASRLRARDAT